MGALTIEEARKVYDVLVAECGMVSFASNPIIRADFIAGVTREGFTEYRFMGALGFGGKFWSSNGRWYVSAYPEDIRVSFMRQEMIERANAQLATWRHIFRGGVG